MQLRLDPVHQSFTVFAVWLRAESSSMNQSQAACNWTLSPCSTLLEHGTFPSTVGSRVGRASCDWDFAPETCSTARARFVQYLTETLTAQLTHTHTAFSMQKTCMHFEDFPSLFRHCHELSHAEENEELPPDTVPLALRFWQLGTKQTATILCRLWAVVGSTCVRQSAISFWHR